VDFRERAIDFREADRRYAELKRQLDAGNISNEEFDAQRRRLMVRDDEGRWWAKSRNTGAWNYHDGNAWVRGTPPDYGRPGTLPEEESMPDRRAQPKESERLPSSLATRPESLATPPGSASFQDRSERKQPRRVRRWLIIAVPLLAAAVTGIILWIIVPDLALYGQGEIEESSGAAPGYALLKHDSGSLSVEVPVEWDERVVVDQEGEKGRSSWSTFLGEGGSAGPSMTAVNDLNSWRNGTPGHQGMYAVLSKELAQEYTDDELVVSGPNDYSSSCEQGTTEDFERPPYSGKMLLWSNCGGNSDHAALTLSAAPKGRECVLVAQMGGLPQVEEETIQHVLNTFSADCTRIK
jgi:hypothetical protein